MRHLLKRTLVLFPLLALLAAPAKGFGQSGRSWSERFDEIPAERMPDGIAAKWSFFLSIDACCSGVLQDWRAMLADTEKWHTNEDCQAAREYTRAALADADIQGGLTDSPNLAGVVSRRNARNRERIDAERAVLGALPGVGHRLRVRLYDDRLVLYAGTDELMTLPRGQAGPGGRRGRVVDYRHVLLSLRRKPMALLNWVHRDGLFPRDAYRRAFDALREGLDARRACRRMVDLLALAHDRCCEAGLATEIEVCARYENRSLLVIANEPFSAWGKIFGSDAMAVAAVDRLVHRSHIFELNVESYRRRAAAAARRVVAGKRDAGKQAEAGPQPRP